jgi:DNA-binding transcriptional ArsR family regulator
MASGPVNSSALLSGILAVFPALVVPCITHRHDSVIFESATDSMNEDLISRDEDISQAALCIKAMAHPLRLKILCLLGKDKASVQEIVDACGTTQSNISQHLAILREKAILNCVKESNRVYYYVDDKRTLKLIQMMREVFCPNLDSTHTTHTD